jgi:hypothetical protein
MKGGIDRQANAQSELRRRRSRVYRTYNVSDQLHEKPDLRVKRSEN